MTRSIQTLSCAAAFILLIGSGLPAHGNIIFSDDLEEPNYPLGDTASPWKYSGNHRTEITASPTNDGQSLHFILNHSDPVPDRTEVVLKADPLRNFTIGQEYWMGFRIFLPADGYVYDDDDEIVFQFHGVADSDLGEPSLNPMLALIVDRGRWRAVNRWDSKRLTPEKGAYEGNQQWTIGNYETNKWTNWVFRIKWSYLSDGILQVWKDGELVIDRKGPNTYNDVKGPYLKIGIYKYYWDGKTTLTDHRDLYYDDIKVGNDQSSYSEVAPQKGTQSTEPPAIPEVPVAPATPSITFGIQ